MDELTRQVGECRAFLVLVTDAALTKHYVKHEVDIAADQQVTQPGFTPLMTCYLTDTIEPDEIARGFEEGVWLAAKLYPAGATTNSASGVTDIRNISPVLERMERIGMVLCVHGEVTDPAVDVFDREKVFIARVLLPRR